MKKGKDLIISVKDSNGKYVAIAAAKACEVDMDCDLIEISSPTSGRAREYIPGRTGWGVNVTHLVPEGTDLFAQMMQVGTEFVLRFTLKQAVMSITNDRMGTAILKKYQASAPVGSLVKGNMQFVGTGELKPFRIDPI